MRHFRAFFTVAVWCMACSATAGQALAQEQSPTPDDRSIEQLVGLLGADLPMRRADAAQALGEKGAEALPAIRKALDDDDWRVRRAGTDALAAMPEQDADMIPRLIELLEDENAWVRDGAVVLLGKYGDQAESAAESLSKLCVDEESWIRISAINSLKSVTKDEKILLPAAAALIRVPDTCWRARGAAVGLLAKHGEGHQPAISALFYLMEHPSEGMWCCIPSAVDALLKLGAEPEEVEQAILKLGRRDEWSNRRLAATLLVKHMPDSESTLPFVKNLAENDPHRKVRAGAERALEQLEKDKP